MKILLAVIPMFFCVLQLCGQTKTMNHLFKDKPKNISLFINPTCQYSQIAQQYCVIPGIRAGVIINKKIIIGGLFNTTTGDITLPDAKGGGKLQMKWGGIHFEYTIWPLHKVHLTIPLSAGIGQLTINESTTVPAAGNPNFYFVEPGLMIEFNIWDYAKFGLGGSYRNAENVSYNSLNTSDVSGFAAVASVKFGKFNYFERKKNKRDLLKSPSSETDKISIPKKKSRIFRKRRGN